MMTPGEFVFGKPAKFYQPFQALMRSLNMPEKAFPHILRHSRATHLLQDGVSIYEVAKLLGDTIATVERVYGHHAPDHNSAAMAEGN